MIRRLRKAARGDEGLSLTEMLIAMLIASVIMLSISVLFISSLRENKTINAKTTSTYDASTGMEAMTRALRVAVVPSGLSAAVTSATDNAITFYELTGTSSATTDPNPTLVTFSVNATKKCLQRDLTPGTKVGTVWSFPATGKVSTCVARGAINASGTPIFTYYPQNADGTISTTPYTTAQAAANLANITAVGLNLTVGDTDNPSVRPTTVQDQVTLINVASN